MIAKEWKTKMKKWTKEACYEAVKDCATKIELREKYPSVHSTIYRNGWKDLFDGLDGRRERTKEECRESALRCKTLAEFKRDYSKECRSSYRHGWLDEFTWLEKNVPEKNVCIYSYEFPNLKTIYIGLTNSPKRRDGEHRGKDHNSTVYKFCQEYNFETPEMKILKKNLPVDPDGRYWEDYYVKKYKKEGWNVLNIAQTGSNGSIGTNATKWTPDLIWKEVYKYNSYRDFLNLTKDTAYRAARKYDMLSEIRAYFGMEIIECIKWSPSLIWNEVYKYNSYTDFFKTKAYYAAWRKGIIPEIKAYYEKRT